MATSIQHVVENFVWRLQALVMTDATSGRKLRLNDRPLATSADLSSGMTRTFILYWDGASPSLEPTDMFARWADHTFTLEVAYSTSPALDALLKLILRDRHDITKALRDHALWTGYDDDNSATEIGLEERKLLRDVLDRSSSVTWYLRQTWECRIQENET